MGRFYIIPNRESAMVAAHAASYYAASARPAPERAALAGSVECDVCVVGGGIAGCSAALHLAERGYSVVLLEQHRIGWGASGRSGAQAIHGVASGQGKLERLIGRGPARAVWDVSIEGLSLMRELIARHHIDCDWADGYMLTAIRPRQDRELRQELEELQGKLDYRSARYMPGEEVRSILQTRRYVSALYDSNGGHLHPLNYTLGLAAAAERAGVRIHESTRALGFTSARVRTPAGEVRARYLVLCGNVYLGNAAPALASKIMAVGTHIIATEPLGAERAQRLITNNAAVSDMNWVLDYFRRSADHRLLFGGRVSYSALGSFEAPGATRARMLRVFPQLAEVGVAYSWGGYVDITLNRAPHFGRLMPNVYFLQGFSGHGIALTGIAGKLIAEAIAGEAERFDVFARIPHHDFPGGAILRRPALVLAMLYYRLRDLL
ncbi:MAG TPA: FAD-binding oxidoreductase [Steroidobacteraceae bacterium]|nr:FAD-binding oxidoreductase [Steroidobacteraceae bacterium]